MTAERVTTAERPERDDGPARNDRPAAGVWALTWRVVQHRRREFWTGSLLFVVFFTMPAATGYALARGYDSIATGDYSATYRWALAVAAAETIRMGAVHRGAIIWSKLWVHMQSFLRANMLAAQMASGGPEAGQPVGSAGSAVTHFRDDTEDVAEFVDGLVDVTGGLIFTVVAGFALGAADVRAAAILILPLIGVAVATATLHERITTYRAADRVATEAVTGLLGDMMAAATTVKVNDAVEPMLSRLAAVADRRRTTAVNDRVLDEGVQAFSEGSADVGLGLVLLVSAGAIASGGFGLGDLALFAAYLGWLSFLPKMIGRLIARRKQVAVAFDRMSKLVADEHPVNTVQPRHLPIDPVEARRRPAAVRPARVPLERLEVRGLRAHYPGGGGVTDVDLTVAAGEFVVVTGPVGAGKSTLLRAILGLAWQADVGGEVRWNGRPVDDPAAFLVPPNAAFLPQVPQLISDTVRDNVGLGPIGDEQLATALELAVVEADIAELPAGASTLIGPRGLRLSGGQRQRLATARALAHAPELLVLDDLSSALDVETELRLWTRLAASGTTVVAVSHRAVAFDRASQLIRLRDGRVE